MSSNPTERTTGIVLYWIGFVCLVFVLKHNIQNIVAKQTAQEQQNRERIVGGREDQARRARKIAARALDRGPSKTPVSENGSSGADEEQPEETGAAAGDAPKSLPSGFRRIDAGVAEVSFHLPETWTRTQTPEKQGEGFFGFLTFTSPDKEASISLWCEPDSEQSFVPTTEEKIIALRQKGYTVSSPQQTTIGEQPCTRWTYSDGETLSMNRVFRHNGRGYSLLFRVPRAKYTEWEATFIEVRTSFRFDDSNHGE